MTTANYSTTIPTTGAHVTHNPETDCYDVFVNGHRLGDRPTEDAARAALYDLETTGRLYTTVQLDEEIAADLTQAHEGEPLGVIDGCPVYGEHSVDIDRHIYAVEMGWHGM